MRARLISFIVAGFLIGALAGAAILLVTTPRGGQPVQSSGTALVGGPFSLVGADGKAVTDADFRGRYMLVFFGFTHCPDICPKTLQQIGDVLQALGPKGRDTKALFVAVDPERDTPAALKAYLASFDPRIIGLTGTPDEVNAAVKAYRAYVRKVPTKGDDYTMDHTASVLLLNSNGEFAGTIAYGESPQAAIAKLKRLVDRG